MRLDVGDLLLLIEAHAQVVLHLVDGVEAHLRRELVVDLGKLLGLDLVDDHVELGRLADELLVRRGLRDLELDAGLGAGLEAENALVELRRA